MNLYALDKNFNIVTIAIVYDNLQWNRRYYDFGDFSVQIPLDVYDPEWAYIGTNDRPELGMIQKIQIIGSDSTVVLLSGFFCEKMLDNRVVYPRYKGTAVYTEAAIRSIFNKYNGGLPISLGEANEPLLGNVTESDFSDDQMGTKFYSMLQPRELSYRVTYDYENNKLLLGVWSGLDRTQSQEINPFKTFSLEFGNIATRNIDIDYSDYKNYAYIPYSADDNGKEKGYYFIDMTNGEPRREIVIDMRSEKQADGETAKQFQDRVIESAYEKLFLYLPVEDININPISDEGYMIDYDLGDKCDVILTDIGVTMESRIVEVFEVFKADGGHTITVGLGNKRITNILRIARS